ncbi:MAG TPA: trypsin-like peptidase domain-containing protein [Polyangiaceae bacterium]|nr:trypsin-like peptidase domain-containing protein [Polyangiaceae bacterium]
MSNLSAISEELSQAAAGAESSVVRVQTRGAPLATGLAWGPGLVVTTARALEGGASVDVSIGGTLIAAKRVGVHVGSDIGVLRVDAELAPLPWAAPASLRVAELVLALARPGEQLRVRLGVLSVLGPEWRLGGGVAFERYIESDLAPARGASGGPLLRPSGELIGLNNGRLARGALLTLPAEGVGRIVDELVAHGRVRRAYLGVAIQAVPLPKGLADSLSRPTGLLVMSVQPDSSAERAGVLLGDVLLELGGAPLSAVGDLERALFQAPLGSQVELSLLRGGARERLLLSAEERR